MIGWWRDIPHAFRTAVPLVIVAVGTALAAFQLEHGGTGRGAFAIIGFGFALLIADSIFGEEQHHKPLAEDLQTPALFERWAVVPPEKFEVVCDTLAAEIGGSFAHQKLHLLGLAAKIKEGTLKEFSFSVPFQGASVPVQVRLTGLAAGEAGFGFHTTPELLAALDKALLPVLGLPLGKLPEE